MLKPWFDLRSGLCKEYGEALIHWSENAWGSPQGVTHKEWTATLRQHGEALLAFVEADDGSIPEEDTVEAAREAFRWTADNLLKLWN